jgi:hypothetical protein
MPQFRADFQAMRRARDSNDSATADALGEALLHRLDDEVETARILRQGCQQAEGEGRLPGSADFPGLGEAKRRDLERAGLLGQAIAEAVGPGEFDQLLFNDEEEKQWTV